MEYIRVNSKSIYIKTAGNVWKRFEDSQIIFPDDLIKKFNIWISVLRHSNKERDDLIKSISGELPNNIEEKKTKANEIINQLKGYIQELQSIKDKYTPYFEKLNDVLEQKQKVLFDHLKNDLKQYTDLADKVEIIEWSPSTP